MLSVLQERIGVRVALVTEFAEGTQVCRHFVGNGSPFGLRVGEPVRLDPEQEGPAGLLRFTSRVEVPLRFSDGHVYGMLWCIGNPNDPLITNGEIRVLGALADLIAEELEAREVESRRRSRMIERTRGVLDRRGPDVVFQPIFDLRTAMIVAAEALSRFGTEPERSPLIWFREAREVGLGIDLEVAAIRSALDHLRDLPSRIRLAVNVSPQTVMSPVFGEALDAVDCERLVIEVTEYAKVDDYDQLNESLWQARAQGAQLAIDDVGAGFASLRHVLLLAPDVIKLDIDLTRFIDADPVRRALVTSLISFARELEAEIAAEGIERREEAEVLRDLGIDYGQGFYLARPTTLVDVAGMIRVPPRRRSRHDVLPPS